MLPRLNRNRLAHEERINADVALSMTQGSGTFTLKPRDIDGAEIVVTHPDALKALLAAEAALREMREDTE